MQHKWNQLSESTKNFMRKQELKEAYQKGYNSVHLNEQMSAAGDAIQSLVKRLIRGGTDLSGTGLGAGRPVRPDTFGGATGITRSEYMKQLEDLLNEVRPTGANVGPDAGFFGLLQRILRGDLTGDALQEQIRSWGRTFRTFGWEFFDNNGRLGLRNIPGANAVDLGIFGGDSSYWNRVAELMSQILVRANVPWNSNFSITDVISNSNRPSAGGDRFMDDIMGRDFPGSGTGL